MLPLVFWAVVAAASAGLIVKFWLDRGNRPEEITWKELAIGMAIITFLVAPGVAKIGWELAKSSLISYNEYWNGWELQALRQDITCSRDGPCRYNYDCDPYIVMVPYSCNCDSKGNCSTCYRPETRYHSCPYVDVEMTYVVQTTIGEYTIDEHRFPNNPQAHRWRRSETIPDGVIQRAGVGAPPFWIAAKSRVDAKSPGPVSKRAAYDNYILASDRTILKQYSAEVERFNALGLLPKLNSGIRDFYLADRVYFVNFRPRDQAVWQKELGYLNAALGSELQGDVHLVIVRDATISNNPDAYVLALKAYWQNTKVFGKNAFSKNGIGVVLGTTDDETVAWARAFTGMPLGNEGLTVAIRSDLKGLALTPEVIIGKVKGEFYAAAGQIKVRGVHGEGALEAELWGLKDPHTKFRRYSMSGKSANAVGAGFLYLKGEIQPTAWQKFWIFFCTFLLSGISWVACAVIGERTYKTNRCYYIAPQPASKNREPASKRRKL